MALINTINSLIINTLNKETLRKHIEEIVDLTDSEFSVIETFFEPRALKKNQFLIQEGENVSQLFFIVSGLLKLSYTDHFGKEHIISFAMENWWETDFPAFFKQSTATMALKCMEPTEVLCLPLANYLKLCLEIPKMQNFFLKKSNMGFIASQQRILNMLTTNTKERYDQLLSQYPTLFQRVSKTQIAAFLGVSRETLSRLSS